MESPLLTPVVTAWVVIPRQPRPIDLAGPIPDVVGELARDAVEKFPWRTMGSDDTQPQEAPARILHCTWIKTKYELMTYEVKISLPPIPVRRVYGASVVMLAIARHIREASWEDDGEVRQVHALWYSLSFTSDSQTL